MSFVQKISPWNFIECIPKRWSWMIRFWSYLWMQNCCFETKLFNKISQTVPFLQFLWIVWPSRETAETILQPEVLLFYVVYARLEEDVAVDDGPYLDVAFAVGVAGGPFGARHLEQVSSDVAVAPSDSIMNKEMRRTINSLLEICNKRTIPDSAVLEAHHRHHRPTSIVIRRHVRQSTSEVRERSELYSELWLLWIWLEGNRRSVCAINRQENR